MAVQYILIGLILVVCTAYVARRIYHALTHAGDPCHGCRLKSSCARHKQPREHRAMKEPCTDQAQ